MYKPFAAELFLEKLRALLAARRVVFTPRHWRKTRDFLLAEGLAEEDVFDILGHLHPEHYGVGPEEDRDGTPGDVMVFFYPYEERTLYIKLKVWCGSDGGHAAVLSFHEEGQHD